MSGEQPYEISARRGWRRKLAGAVGADRPALVVEPPGVRLDDVKIPWPSIRQIVVPGPDRIGIRLRFGAPLPAGMDSVIYDPKAPDALHLEDGLPAGALDTARLEAAVRAFAPPGVRVAAEDPARAFRQPSPRSSGTRQDTPAKVLDIRMHDHGSSSSGWFTYKPYPVVGFTLPDGRHVIAETCRPGQGLPGADVLASYDTGDPTDVWVHGPKPPSIRRMTALPGTY